MDIFPQVIEMLTKEEVRHFKLFSKRTNASDDRKDLELFDYVRKCEGNYQEERIFRKLYESEDKNSFYRLKNRVLSDVNKSLILQHTEVDENLFMFHLLSLGRFYRTRNQFKIAQYYIRKAEKKAISVENFELLDVIYSELIQLSHEIVAINPEEYILKRKENREKLYQIRQVEDILAAVIFRLKVTQNYGSGSSERTVFDLLEKTVNDFSDNPAVKKSAKLRFTLYQAVSRVLLSRHDYPTLEGYLLSTFEEFSKEGLFTKTTHDTKLQMLTYLVNTLNRNKKTQQSLEFCEKLREGMDEFNQLLYKKYLVYYYNGLVINYTQTRDFDKCIAILEEAIKAGTFHDQPFYECLYITNLSVSYFNNRKFNKAMKALVQATIHDGFKTFESSFRLQIAIYELMLRVEMQDEDTLQKRIEKVRKEFDSLLKMPGYERDLAMIGLIEKMADIDNEKTAKTLQKSIKDFIKAPLSDGGADASLIHYRAWLEEKSKDLVNA